MLSSRISNSCSKISPVDPFILLQERSKNDHAVSVSLHSALSKQVIGATACALRAHAMPELQNLALLSLHS